MQLDYNAANRRYILKLPREEGNPREFMVEHGLDFWQGSPAHEAILSTAEPYAAAPFIAHATPAALSQLKPLVDRISASWAPSSSRHFDAPYDKSLWPFQIASVEYALDCQHALIADQPGLGKTQCAITIANEMQARQVLVVCPASIRFQWIARVKEWTTMGIRYPVPNTLIYPILTGARGVNEHAAYTVVSWDLLRNPGIRRALARMHFDLLVLDEAHMAANPNAARTRAIFGGGECNVITPLLQCCERAVALTGTPLPHRLRQAYVLADGLCPESIDWMSHDAFVDRFNPSKLIITKDNKRYIDERVGRAGELQARLRGNFMVRHMKREVMTQLQFPVYDLIRMEETDAIKQALFAESLLAIDPENLEGADATVLGQIATARRLMGVALAPQVAGYVKMLVQGGEDKLVVFAWHVEVLDILCRDLHSLGVIRVDGSDGPKSKYTKVQQFIADPAKRVIIGNVLSLGTGTDGLQEVCSHGLIAEPDWVHGNNVQCFDRLDRGGQRCQVQGDICVAPGSIGEKVLASALRHAQIVHMATDRRL